MAKTPKPPTTTMPTEEQIDQAAAWLITWIRGLDPNYRQNIEAAKETYLWTDRQCLGAFVGYVLENDLYMQISTNPAFEPGHISADGPTTCERCGGMFSAAFMGQRFCSNDCAVFNQDKFVDQLILYGNLITPGPGGQPVRIPEPEPVYTPQPPPPPRDDATGWDEV